MHTKLLPVENKGKILTISFIVNGSCVSKGNEKFSLIAAGFSFQMIPSISSVWMSLSWRGVISYTIHIGNWIPVFASGFTVVENVSYILSWVTKSENFVVFAEKNAEQLDGICFLLLLPWEIIHYLAICPLRNFFITLGILSVDF